MQQLIGPGEFGSALLNLKVKLLVGSAQLLLHINSFALIGCVLLASLGQLLIFGNQL